MAHSCPICDSYCTCGGDWNDFQLDGTSSQLYCTHCNEFDDCDDDWPEDDELTEEERNDNKLAFEAEMKNMPPFNNSEKSSDNEKDDLPF